MQATLRVCLLIVYLIGCATLFDTVATCDVGGILTCNQILGTSTQSLSEGVLTDANTLNQTCSLLGNYTTCVDKLTSCNSQIKLWILIVKDVVDFLCTDSYPAILDHSECWNNPVFKSDINQCMIPFKKTTISVNGQIGVMGLTWAFRQLCVTMHDVTHCMSSAARTRCGAVPQLQNFINMMTATLGYTYPLKRGCSAPFSNRISTTTIKSITTSARRCSRTTTDTSDSSTTKYSYALYVTSIISCIVRVAL